MRAKELRLRGVAERDVPEFLLWFYLTLENGHFFGTATLSGFFEESLKQFVADGCPIPPAAPVPEASA